MLNYYHNFKELIKTENNIGHWSTFKCFNIVTDFHIFMIWRTVLQDIYDTLIIPVNRINIAAQCTFNLIIT